MTLQERVSRLEAARVSGKAFHFRLRDGSILTAAGDPMTTILQRPDICEMLDKIDTDGDPLSRSLAELDHEMALDGGAAFRALIDEMNNETR